MKTPFSRTTCLALAVAALVGIGSKAWGQVPADSCRTIDFAKLPQGDDTYVVAREIRRVMGTSPALDRPFILRMGKTESRLAIRPNPLSAAGFMMFGAGLGVMKTAPAQYKIIGPVVSTIGGLVALEGLELVTTVIPTALLREEGGKRTPFLILKNIRRNTLVEAYDLLRNEAVSLQLRSALQEIASLAEPVTARVQLRDLTDRTAFQDFLAVPELTGLRVGMIYLLRPQNHYDVREGLADLLSAPPSMSVSGAVQHWIDTRRVIREAERISTLEDPPAWEAVRRLQAYLTAMNRAYYPPDLANLRRAVFKATPADFRELAQRIATARSAEQESE